MNEQKLNYPACEKRPVVDEFFGVKVTDNYRWLENANDPEVVDWVAKENAMTDEWFTQKAVTEKIERLKAETPGEQVLMMSPCGEGWICTCNQGSVMSAVNVYYADRNLKDFDLIVASDQFDGMHPAIMALPHFFMNNLIAVKAQEDNEQAEAAVLVDRNTKEVIAVLSSIWFGGWSIMQPVFYYARTNYNRESGFTELKVCGYNAMTHEENILYEELSHCGSATVMGLFGKILIRTADDIANGRFIEINESTGEVFVLNSEPAEVNFLTVAGEDYYFISKELSNNGTIIAVKPGQTIVEGCVVREATDDVVEGGFFLKDSLYLTVRRKAEPILIKADAVKGDQVIDFPYHPCSALYSGPYDMESALISLSSFNAPSTYVRFDGEKIETVYKADRKEYSDIIIEQRWASSYTDGEKVPYYICYGKNTKPDGNRPVQMTGYGGYNQNYYSTPIYRDNQTSSVVGEWVRKGGVYVASCLRGGGEFGKSWHEAGMKDKKKNCFGDFIGIAEALIADGWTKPEKICAVGASNGGLLVSAALTMRPDLFGCVLLGIPHTDMIRFTEDTNGPRYTPEYGDPFESKEMLEYMLSYSPVHNVRETSYPPVYLYLGEVDNNVPPYHGKKFVAELQTKNTSDNPILLRTNPAGGHDFGSGDAFWQVFAEMQLFMERHLGIE